MSKSKLTINDHKKLADDLAITEKHLSRALSRVQKFYPKTSNLMRQFLRLLPEKRRGALDLIRDELDRAYYVSVTGMQFHELGHIYFDGQEDRYENAIRKIADDLNGVAPCPGQQVEDESAGEDGSTSPQGNIDNPL